MPRPQLSRLGRAIRRVWFPRAMRRSDRAWDRVVSRVNGLELDENTILLAFAFPVVDSNLMLVGVITIADLGRIAKDSRDLAPVLLAADLALPAETVQIGDSLLTVIRKMGVRGTGALPVVDQPNERLIGMVTRAHVLGLYQRALAGDHAGEAARSARP